MAPSSSPAAATLWVFLAAALALSTVSARPSLPPSDHMHAAPFKQANLTIFMHGAINVTDFVALPGIPGVGSSSVTAAAGPFASMFVYHIPITSTADPASQSLGSMQGAGITTSFDGATFHVSATATLNTSQYTGTLNILGLSGGKVPLAGGTDDFLFVQGYSVSTRVAVVALNTTYRIDLYLYWPQGRLY